MKKSVSVLTAFSFAIVIGLMSCQKTNNSTPSLVGKWTMKEGIGSYTNYGVNRKDTTSFTAADYFDFHADSTLTIVFEGVMYNGKWKVTNSRLFITETHFMDYSSGFDLPILTNTDLQLYYTETRPDIYLEQKLNLKASR